MNSRYQAGHNADKHTNVGFKAAYKGEYLGMFATAKEARAAINKARTADAKENLGWL